MKLRHKPLALLLATFAALAVAGCGGGDSSDTTAAATSEEQPGLTKAELIEQGDAICAEVNAAVGVLGREAEEAALPDTVGKSTNLFIGMLESLQDLGPPTDDDGSYAKFMETMEEFAVVEDKVKLAVEREDPGALGEAATEAAPALEEFRAQAAIYGFEECSEDAVAATSAGGEAAPGEELGGEEEGGVEAEPEYAEPEAEEAAPEEAAPETGGAGGGTAPESGGGESGGSESGGVGPG